MASRKKVKEGEEFRFCNGATASTVAECRKIVKTLTIEEFSHHVHDDRNDFYLWIRECISPTLAETIKDVREKDSLVALLK